VDERFHAELKNIEALVSGLEARLGQMDVQYERDREVRERKHKRETEPLRASLSYLKAAQAALEGAMKPERGLEVPSQSVIVTPPRGETNGSTPSRGSTKVASNGAKGFSPRREIEKLLLEMEPGQDIKQGEIRLVLESRFPQHKPLLKAPTISSALRRISKAGGLVKVSEGSGSEPNVYRLPDHSHGGQEESSELSE
jgi:hypothetical protein